MKLKGTILLWVFAVFITFMVSAEIPAATYSQSYAILIKGEMAGSETVTEKTEAGGEIVSSSEHEIYVSDGLETKRMTFATRMVRSQATGIPVSYSYWYTSGSTGDSYEFTIKDAQITRILHRGGRTSEATVPLEPDLVFLDFNVYHQYDYIVRKYDIKKGGRQTFADFIPVIANDIPIALTYLGENTVKSSSGTLPVRDFTMEFVGIWGGTLSVDKDGRLVRLVIPSQDLQVIRRDLLPESEEKR